MKYPPLVKPATETSTVAISYDFYPTVVELAGAKLPANQTIDGKSLLSVLADSSAKVGRSAIHFHYPHFHHHRPASAIIEGEWKLLQYLDNSETVELYHLKSDLGETNDLSKEKAGRVADLKKKLQVWRTEVIATMPISNPHHNAERAGEWWNMRTGAPLDSAARKRYPPTEKDL